MGKWSFGYAVIKGYTQIAFWLSHRNVTVLGKENIPKNEPIIFSPNHQNALMDPLSVSCTSNTQPVWLARADIFQSKFVNAILHLLKILPVYRIRDGKENLGKNENIFNKAIQVLENNKAIALFPEAAHSGKRQMVSHKKAVPRIAFLTEEKNDFKLGLKIVPVGIYYSHYWHFNRSVLINYGEPINLSDYKSIYQKSEHQATMNLKKDIFSAIEKLSIEIKSKENYDNYEILREMLGDDFETKKKWHKYKEANRFYSDKKLIKLLERKEKEKPQEFEELHNKLNNYRKLLKGNGIESSSISLANESLSFVLLQLIIGVIALPLMIAGILIFAIPFLIPHWYIRKKVTDDTFISTFQFVAGLITHFLFFTFAFFLFVLINKSLIISVLFVIGSIIIGKLAYRILEIWKKVLSYIGYQIKKYKNNETFNKIEESRADCKQIAEHFLID